MFLLTGCWSSHEIEELGLTFAMGIDKGEETELEKSLTKLGRLSEKDRITMIYQYVNEQAAGSNRLEEALIKNVYQRL
ncbi:hypothetical protein PO124_18985 [Bacillus licheniformis]|nr:hypothetical protein [Bacillus licheniformis]